MAVGLWVVGHRRCSLYSKNPVNFSHELGHELSSVIGNYLLWEPVVCINVLQKNGGGSLCGEFLLCQADDDGLVEIIFDH